MAQIEVFEELRLAALERYKDRSREELLVLLAQHVAMLGAERWFRECVGADLSLEPYVLDGSRGLMDLIERVATHASELRAESLAAPGLARTRVAKSGAQAKLARDPVQAAKTAVKLRWDAWQRGERPRYDTAAQFARAMLKDFPALKTEGTVSNWATGWKRMQTKAS